MTEARVSGSLGSFALVAALGSIVSCGGRSLGAHDAGGASSGSAGAGGGDAAPGLDATPGHDAALGLDTAPGDPPKPNCEQKVVDLKDVCADPATCAVRRAVDFDCGYQTISRLNLAVSPMGAAFVAFGLDGPNVVDIFEVDAPRHLEVTRPSFVQPIVHTGGADGARVLLTAPSSGRISVARPVNGDWAVEPLDVVGTVLDFLLADDGAVTVLEARAGDGGSPQLLLTDLAISGAPSVVIAEGGPFEYAKMARAHDGSPIVVFTQPGPAGRLVVRRWQAGAVTELGQLPRERLGPPYPALRLATSLAPDDSTVAAFSAEGGLFRLPAVPLFPVVPWPATGCGGFEIVNSPGLCPTDSQPTRELGEQVVGLALASTWLASITGSFQSSCSWGGGSTCFETLPCQCNETETFVVQTPRLRVRAVEATPRETSIALSRPGLATSVTAATDATGLVYVAAHDTPTRVRLFVIDPAKL